MATTGNTTLPSVVRLGGAREERYAYTDAEVIVAGDLIRLTSASTIKLAEPSSAGAVHGIALYDGTTDGDVLPVLLFATDTVVKIQCIDGVAPEDLSKGTAYTLEKGTNVWAITDVSVNGVGFVVDYASTGLPWESPYGDSEDPTVDNNSVLVRFTSATLDATVA